MTVRFGIIGTGHACDVFADALRGATGAKLHSIYSRKRSTAEAFAAKHGASRQQCHDSFETFLGDRYMDAVYIGTPPGLHADQADAAAAAGRHVFVEKPMATTSAGARRMIEACAQAGVTLGVGYQNRFHPLHEKVRDWVRAGQIGEVVLARARWFLRYAAEPSDWRRSRELAGWWALGDVGTHCVDLLRWLFGEVKDVTARLRHAAGAAYETEDSAVLFLRHQDGTPSIVECSTAAVAPGTLLEVLGTEGWVRATGSIGMDGEGELVNGNREGRVEEFTEWARPADLFVREIQDFLLAIREGRPPRASGEDGLRDVEILEQARESSGR